MNYIVGHLPYGSKLLTDNHGLIVDPAQHLTHTTEKVADLLAVDEVVAFGFSRLCCDVGAYMRAASGPIPDLLPVFARDGTRLREMPDLDQVALARLLAHQHVLRLCTRIEHSVIWLPTIVVDLRSFRDELGPDICLGFNGDVVPPLVEETRKFLEARGMLVSMNKPLAGCLLPTRYDNNDCVAGFAVGVNERVHEACQEDGPKRKDLRTVFEELYEMLAQFGC